MGLYPGADLRLLPENATAPRITPRVLVYHSIVGSGSSAYGYFLNGTSLESTMINPRSDEAMGHIMWQLMDTERRADANYYANPFAISVETGDRGQPDTQPWDAGQVRRNIEFGVWCVNTHPAIHKVRCTGPYGTGIGYHAMWGAPSPWTPARGKTCPGKARVAQFEREVLPMILLEAPSGVDYDPEEFTVKDADKAVIADIFDERLRALLGNVPAWTLSELVQNGTVIVKDEKKYMWLTNGIWARPIVKRVEAEFWIGTLGLAQRYPNFPVVEHAAMLSIDVRRVARAA